MTQRNVSSDLILGIALLFGAHILAVIVGGLATQLIFTIANVLPAPFNRALNSLTILSIYALVGFGIAQLVYVLPLVDYLERKRQYEVMKGVLVGAVLTALLNGGCWLLWLSTAG